MTETDYLKVVEERRVFSLQRRATVKKYNRRYWISLIVEVVLFLVATWGFKFPPCWCLGIHIAMSSLIFMLYSYFYKRIITYEEYSRERN